MDKQVEVTKMKRTVISAIASRLEAINNCRRGGNVEWEGKHTEAVHKLVKEHLPHGSGFDGGTQLVNDAAKWLKLNGKITFCTAFHHMDDAGYYDGWTSHNVVVKPTFTGIDIRVTGRNKNDIKEYIAETFHDALTQEIED